MGERELIKFVGWEEAIENSGYSKNSIKRLIKDSGFPAYKLSPRKYQFVISEIEDWKRERKAK